MSSDFRPPTPDLNHRQCRAVAPGVVAEANRAGGPLFFAGDVEEEGIAPARPGRLVAGMVALHRRDARRWEESALAIQLLQAILGADEWVRRPELGDAGSHP